MKVKSGSVLVAKHPPYGYDVEAADDGRKFRLVLNLSEARVVELVYKLFLYGSGDNSTYAGKWTHGKTIRGKDNPSDKHVQV